MSRSTLPCIPVALDSLRCSTFQLVEPKWAHGVRGATKQAQFVEVK